MNKTLRTAASILFSLALIIGLLCLILYAVANDDEYMAQKFAVHANPGITGVASQEYPALAKGITAYLTGRADTMQTTLLVHGQQKEAYSEKELLHMRDVRALLDLCLKVAWACGLLVAFCMPIAFVRVPSLRKTLARAYIGVSLFLCTLGGIAVFWASRDFAGLFTLFHRLFFTNDLWLLNPNQDLLLQLMPTSFFIDYATDMGLAWLVFVAIFFLVSLVYLIIRKRKA